jgi:5'-3' exonuclease
MQSSFDNIAVDGNNFLWRAFFTFQSDPLGAVFGFVKHMRFIIKKFDPKQVVVCWDGRKATATRQKLFPAYKSTRDKVLAELESFYEQFPIVQGLVPLLGLKQVQHEQFEADDCLGTLSALFPNCLVVSTDRDLLQLVAEGATIYNPIKQDIVNASNFEKFHPVPASQYRQFKILIGDGSDNIPSIIGEVGAKTILDTYGSLMNFLELKPEAINSLKKKYKNIFEMEKLTQLMLNVQLMDLKNVPRVGEAVAQEVHLEEKALKQLFLEAGFNSFLEDWDNFIQPFRKMLTK